MSVWCPHSAQRTIWPSVIRLRTSAVWYYRTIIQSGGRYNVRGICFQQLVRSSSRGANFSGLCSSVGMECACGRITSDPWTLAKVRGARSISSLSPRTYLYCFHVLVVDRKWIGHLGFLFVSAIAVDDLGILITLQLLPLLFCRAKSLQTPSNIFVVNLAICDFLMMVKTPIFIYNSFNRGFASGVLG